VRFQTDRLAYPLFSTYYADDHCRNDGEQLMMCLEVRVGGNFGVVSWLVETKENGSYKKFNLKTYLFFNDQDSVEVGEKEPERSLTVLI
jgi:hypothetical protein